MAGMPPDIRASLFEDELQADLRIENQVLRRTLIRIFAAIAVDSPEEIEFDEIDQLVELVVADRNRMREIVEAARRYVQMCHEDTQGNDARMWHPTWQRLYRAIDTWESMK